VNYFEMQERFLFKIGWFFVNIQPSSSNELGLFIKKISDSTTPYPNCGIELLH
jgi:hypothetical protein